MIDDNTGKSLSNVWASAQKEDIGSGFRRASKAVQKELLRKRNSENQQLENAYRRIQYMDVASENSGRDRHPFLNGNSKFIFYRIKQPKLKIAKKTTKIAINIANKVAPSRRIRFSADLGSQIEQTSKFFLNEILPRSQALMTAISNVDETMQQLTEEKANLPMEFIKNKTKEAINLRIIRFLCEQYELSAKEAKMMYAEFIARTKPPLF